MLVILTARQNVNHDVPLMLQITMSMVTAYVWARVQRETPTFLQKKKTE